MNEIKTMKKNSKKGFTLVELVVVIAILAILAAIAIPVVSSTITSSQRSSALSNAQTLELGLKEAHAQIIAGDTSAGFSSTSKISDVITAKSLQAVEQEVNINNVDYVLCWHAANDKVLYVTGTESGGIAASPKCLDDSVTVAAADVAILDIDSTTATVMDLF